MQIIIPLSNEELERRRQDYEELKPSKMALKYSEELYRTTEVIFRECNYEIQYNFCANPFCKNFGSPQTKYNVRHQPNRYKVIGTQDSKKINCNPDKSDPDGIPTLNCFSSTVSNWSISEEIDRLLRINTVVPIEKNYIFHKESCSKDSTPFEQPKDFYKRGFSTSNSQKYQCKECKKITNVLPTKKRSTTYHQQRNDILHQFAKLLINRVPVSRTCDLLGIARGTYYNKLEWLYRCCLEFLEDRETKTLSDQNFNDIWLNTDKLIYFLNNVRKKGQNKKDRPMEDKQLPTQVVVTADVFSRYVFRADIAYDWDITLEQIKNDTELYKEDHLHRYLSKNARFGRYSIFPKPPTINDTQLTYEYNGDINEFNKREQYVDGLHVNQTYTTLAHLWLTKQLLNANKWRFITDEDPSLITAYNRVFNEEIKNNDAYYFLSKTNKSLSRNEAYEEFVEAKKELLEWGKTNNLSFDNLTELAEWYISDILKTHKFHNTLSTPNGEIYNTYAKNPIEHPLATIDRGKRQVDVLTDVSHLKTYQLASLIVKVNDNAVNSFMQTVRRRLSILERPLTTARGEGKSYIYSNFNPRYAQMAITILRTYYNFCLPFKSGGTEETPAQRLGISDKVYGWKDIIYKR